MTLRKRRVIRNMGLKRKRERERFGFYIGWIVWRVKLGKHGWRYWQWISLRANEAAKETRRRRTD